MIDINLIRNDKAAVAAALDKRGYVADLDEILRLDGARRERSEEHTSELQSQR